MKTNATYTGIDIHHSLGPPPGRPRAPMAQRDSAGRAASRAIHSRTIDIDTSGNTARHLAFTPSTDNAGSQGSKRHLQQATNDLMATLIVRNRTHTCSTRARATDIDSSKPESLVRKNAANTAARQLRQSVEIKSRKETPMLGVKASIERQILRLIEARHEVVKQRAQQLAPRATQGTSSSVHVAHTMGDERTTRRLELRQDRLFLVLVVDLDDRDESQITRVRQHQSTRQQERPLAWPSATPRANTTKNEHPTIRPG